MSGVRIKAIATGFGILLFSSVANGAYGIPAQLQGKWRIKRIIPTRTITCWDDRQARSILSTEIEYSPTIFRWENHAVTNPSSASRTLSESEFHDKYYGGPNDSQVDFKQLGIRSPTITILSIEHPDANITGGGTVEIPGDTVLLESRNRIILSVCNVYFEADRLTTSR